MAIISVDNLTHTYGAHSPFEKHAIRGVTLDIEQGELLGIIGHTGSGKSTFIQHLNGLLRPNDGRVLLDGVDIWEKPKQIRAVRFRVGMVFQYPEHQLFEDTIYKDIAFGPKNMGLDESEIDRRVRQAAAYVGLDESLLDKSPFDLSGGEKRRAAIAGVMAMEPEVLILDEPTAGLDPRGREQILSMIQDYRKTRGTTVLLVTHSMEDVARVADRVLVMADGQVAMLDTVEAVFSRAEELEAIGRTDMKGGHSDEIQFMQELQQESARELFGEFTRRHNLVRWGIWYDQVVNHSKYPSDTKNVSKGGKDNDIIAYVKEGPCREYYPIPDQQIVLSNYNLDNKEYAKYGL